METKDLKRMEQAELFGGPHGMPDQADPEKDVLLLYSGGLDSMICAGLLREQGYRVTALFFDLDQHTNAVEWKATEVALAAYAKTQPEGTVRWASSRISDYKQHVANIPLIGGGTIPNIAEPSVTYFVPGRNIIFLLYAAVIGHQRGFRKIAYAPHTWAHCGDNSPNFISAFTEALKWGMGMEGRTEPYEILTPILRMGKDEAVGHGARLGLPLHLTWSCHDAKEKHCGVCHNCPDRREAFLRAGIEDLTEYLEEPPRLTEETYKKDE